jgi:aminobenzoyl-glutamate utilization protein A
LISENELVKFRRELHAYPETGWCEFVTTAKVVEKLRSFGLNPIYGRQVINPDFVAGRNPNIVEEAKKAALAKGISREFIDSMQDYTGAAVIVETGRPGPVLAIRFDMDCVDVEEARESGHRPFDGGWSSTNPGHMHACGHDGHTTMGIAVCNWLAENKDKLCGTIKVVFQPAEEGVRGARPMTETGIFDDVDYFFGNHLGFNLPTGTISANPGVFLASTKLDASFTGLAAHSGSNAHKGKNALLAAATAALAVHAISRPVQEATALNVGTLVAGQGRNVVAPNAFMQLEVRGETEEVNAYLRDEAVRKINASAEMYDCKVEITKAGEATEFKPDPEAVDLVNRAAAQVTDRALIRPLGLKLGSEDCTIMLRRVQSHGGKGTFIIFGCRTSAGHHQRLFDFDEKVIGVALRFYENLIPLINGIR